MVAVSSYKVARSGMGMVAWTFGVLLALSTLVHASPDIKIYGDGDVSGDEDVIDQLEDYVRSYSSHHIDAVNGGQPHRSHQKVNEKIKFGVSPKDPRYYDPIPLDRRSKPAEEELLHYLPPNLNVLAPRLPQQPQYPAEVLQYSDEEVQYPAQYGQEDHYPEQYPAVYPGYPNLRLPEEALIPDPRGNLLNLRDEIVGSRDDLPEEEEELRDDGRDEDKRMLGEVDEESGKVEENDKDKKKANIRAFTSQPEEVNYINRSPSHVQQSGYLVDDLNPHSQLSDFYFTAIVAGCTAAAVCAVIGAGICWYRLNKSHRAAQDAEYPAYGVTGPNKDLSPSSGDRKLAQSAHMYHYQHQKQQMIALENRSSGGERHGSTSDVDSEEEGEDNEYTVYECPGLAPTGEMEVKNPLFQDDPTPATPSVRKEKDEDDEDEEDEEQKTK